MHALPGKRQLCFSPPNSGLLRAAVTAWLLLAQLAGPAFLFAQTPLSDSSILSDQMRAKLLTTGSITLRDANFIEALFAIRRAWDVNIVAGNDLKSETVNCEFVDTPLHEVLDTILSSRGYCYRPVGNSLIVAKLEDTDALKPLFESAVIPIQNVNPEEIVPAVTLYLSKFGKIQPVPGARRIMVLDYPDRIELIRAKIAEFDSAAAGNTPADTAQPGTIVGDAGGATPGPQQPLKVAYFRPQFVKAETLVPPLQQLLSVYGRVSAIPLENRILVVDTPEKLELITEAIKTLDVPRPQVRIYALIYDASMSDVAKLGVNWSSVAKGNNLDAAGVAQDQLALNTITAAAPAAGAANGALTVLSLNSNLDLNSVINALATLKDSRLLADPNVSVVDNETARIEIVTEIPYQQLTQSSGGGNIGTTAFREAGVTLNVTPQIAHDGTILMKVNPKFSLLTGFTPQDNQPIIDRRETNTTVRVSNRQTIVLGGLRQRSSIDENSGIPFLKDIKFLGIGYLFKYRETSKRDSELLVFITPEIMDFEGFNRVRDQNTFYASQECLDSQADSLTPLQCQGPYCDKCGKHHHRKRIVDQRYPPVAGTFDDAGIPADAILVEDRPAPSTGAPVSIAPESASTSEVLPPVAPNSAGSLQNPPLRQPTPAPTTTEPLPPIEPNGPIPPRLQPVPPVQPNLRESAIRYPGTAQQVSNLQPAKLQSPPLPAPHQTNSSVKVVLPGNRPLIAPLPPAAPMTTPQQRLAQRPPASLSPVSGAKNATLSSQASSANKPPQPGKEAASNSWLFPANSSTKPSPSKKPAKPRTSGIKPSHF
ncbi:MAG: secretin N-terminal domain-containing protein [Pirellulales bacterium]|nr:secretin N-terminal domain-containing protein [Pirellulales bacterium]